MIANERDSAGLRGNNNIRRGVGTKNQFYSEMQSAQNVQEKIEAGFCEGGRKKKSPRWPEEEERERERARERERGEDR